MCAAGSGPLKGISLSVEGVGEVTIFGERWGGRSKDEWMCCNTVCKLDSHKWRLYFVFGIAVRGSDTVH